MTFICVRRTEERADYSTSQTEINGRRLQNKNLKLPWQSGRSTWENKSTKAQRTSRNACIKKEQSYAQNNK